MIHLLQTLLPLAFPVLLIAGALSDAATYTIPNRISLALILLFPVTALALGLPLATIGLNLAVGVAGLLIGMLMFGLRWIGGGDAKLFAASALWLGLTPALSFMAYTALAGGALAVGLLALRSAPVRALVPQGPAWFERLSKPGESVPYGLAIAVGALAAFPLSPLAPHV